MVSSHNDLFKPDNILFDGQRIWLVDWEAAFLNDPYADLAAVANQVVTNDEEEMAYLMDEIREVGEYADELVRTASELEPLLDSVRELRESWKVNVDRVALQLHAEDLRGLKAAASKVVGRMWKLPNIEQFPPF